MDRDVKPWIAKCVENKTKRVPEHERVQSIGKLKEAALSVSEATLPKGKKTVFHDCFKCLSGLMVEGQGLSVQREAASALVVVAAEIGGADLAEASTTFAKLGFAYILEKPVVYVC
jgi:hypothetical protein